MRTATKVAAYAAGLVALLGAATAVGSAVGPIGAAATDPGHSPGAATASAAPAAPAAAPEQEAMPGGLLVSRHGYTLRLLSAALPPGTATPVAFQVLGPHGRPVTGYEQSHDEDLHLVAVRRDLTGFQHVHPRLDDGGTWTVPLALSPGQWRLVADFTPTDLGEGLTLGADLAVAGDYAPRALPQPAATAEVDGYTVTLDGHLVPGQETVLTLSVSRGGEPVTDLEPYLSAYGHLVVLRAADLAYLHVHPTGEPGDGTTPPGPDIAFAATAPSVGDYRLFLDFRHGGVVRTAEFTVGADGTPAATGQPPSAPATEHGDDGHTH